MSKLIKQYHIDKVNAGPHIEIHWDIFNMCNYHCTYCYMRPTDEWNKIANWDQQKDIINTLANTEVPVYLKLIGGEPTLHPKFNEFVSMLHNSLYCVNSLNNSITVISNNTQYKKLIALPTQVIKDINLILTFHAEEANVSNFIENIVQLQAGGFTKIKVSVMAHFNLKYQETLKELFRNLKALDIEFDIAYITVHGRTAKINNEYFAELSSIDSSKGYHFEFDDHVEYYSTLTLRDPINSGLTQFKGWNCNLNEFHISIYGKITQRCISKTVQLEEIIKRSADYTVTCPNKSCIHDCFLGFIKTSK